MANILHFAFIQIFSPACIIILSQIYMLTQLEVPGFATFLKVLILLHTSIHIHNTNKQKYGAGFDIQENNGLHDKLTGDSQHSPVQSVPILDGSFRSDWSWRSVGAIFGTVVHTESAKIWYTQILSIRLPGPTWQSENHRLSKQLIINGAVSVDRRNRCVHVCWYTHKLTLSLSPAWIEKKNLGE